MVIDRSSLSKFKDGGMVNSTVDRSSTSQYRDGGMVIDRSSLSKFKDGGMVIDRSSLSRFKDGGMVTNSTLPKYASGGIIGNGRSLADDQLLHLPAGSGILTHTGVDNIGGAEAIRALNQDTFTKFKPEDRPKAGYQSILAQNGEGVLTPRGVANLGGEGMLNVVNRPKIPQFATGGIVGGGSSSVALPKLQSASSVNSNNKLDINVSGDFDRPGVDTMAGREMISAIQAVVNQTMLDNRRSRTGG
jgi:hypothetical protein